MWCVVVWFVVVKRRRQSFMATQRHVFGGSWCGVVCCGVVCCGVVWCGLFVVIGRGSVGR